MISVSELNKKGFRVVFEDQIGKVLSENNELIAEAKFNGTFYEIVSFFSKKVENFTEKPEYYAMQSKLEFWHNRFGHCSQTYLKEMLRKI